MKKVNRKSGYLVGLVLVLILFQPYCTDLASGADRPLIAVVRSRNIGPYNQAIDGFEKELNSGGIKPIISYYDLEGVRGREKMLLDEAKDLNPDLILAVGTEAAILCKDFFKKKPVVFTMVLDSVQSGITENYNPTRSNLTGVILTIPIDVQFKKLKEIVPGIKTIGMLYDSNTRTERVKDIYNVTERLGLKLVAKPVSSSRDIPSVLNSVVRESDALWAEVDTLIYVPQTAEEIILVTFREKIPFMAFSSPYVKAGALIAFECDYYDIGRQTGEIANSILKGKNPGTISIAFPRKRNLVINKRTAETIGISIPPHILKETVKVFGQ